MMFRIKNNLINKSENNRAGKKYAAMLLIRMLPNSINVLTYLLVYQQVKRKKRYFIINKIE